MINSVSGTSSVSQLYLQQQPQNAPTNKTKPLQKPENMPAVSNTSPISNLASISRLDLLRKQFSELFIPEAVQTELLNLPVASVRKVIDDARRADGCKRAPRPMRRLSVF